MKVKSAKTNSQGFNINEIIYDVDQVVAFIYAALCGLWFVYIIIDIFKQLRKRRRLVNIMLYGSNSHYVNSLFLLNETIFRNYLFLAFLIFEILFCLNIHSYGLSSLFVDSPNINISIGSNCTLESNSFIGFFYDDRISGIVSVALSLFSNYSFSMMIWLFGASLLHLSIAARNELKVKTVLKFILFGVVYTFIVVVFELIRYTIVFGIMVQSVMNQLNFFVVLYIAKKKFLPAMNSRIIDTFHLHNTAVYLKQVRLLKQYKILIFVLLFTFELFILKDLIFFNIFMIIYPISSSACWLHVTYHIPAYSLSHFAKDLLLQISNACLIICHLIDFIVYLNLIIVNLNFMFCHSQETLKQEKYAVSLPNFLCTSLV